MNGERLGLIMGFPGCARGEDIRSEKGARESVSGMVTGGLLELFVRGCCEDI